MNTRFLSSSLFLCVFALLGIGLVQVYSSSYIFAIDSFNDGLFFFKKQLIFTFVGLAVLVFTSQIPFHLIKNWGWLVWPAAALSLALTFVPGLGVRVGGALRWIQLPFGFRFEPAEFLKIAFSIVFASLICRSENKLSRIHWGWIAFAISLPILFLLKQPDFGSFVIILLVATILLYSLGLNLKWFIGAGIAALPVLYLLVWNVPYRKARVQAFLDPWSDPAQKGFQVIQSMLSVQSGGLSGHGIGQGQGKLFFLPEAHTDFTMAVLGEELGFIGILLILSIYAFIVFRGLQIAIKAEDLYKKIIAIGLTATFGFSVFINVGVVMGLLPTKGLTMPFLSYGGSSLVMFCFLFGLLLNIEMSEQRH